MFDRRLVIALFIFGLLLGATLGIVYGRYSTPYTEPHAPAYDVRGAGFEPVALRSADTG